MSDNEQDGRGRIANEDDERLAEHGLNGAQSSQDAGASKMIPWQFREMLTLCVLDILRIEKFVFFLDAEIPTTSSPHPKKGRSTKRWPSMMSQP